MHPAGNSQFTLAIDEQHSPFLLHYHGSYLTFLLR